MAYKSMDEINHERAKRVAEPYDPAHLANQVRLLASQAHRILTRTLSPKFEDLDDLRQHVERLQEQFDHQRRLQGMQFNRLQKWLDGVDRRIRSRQDELEK
jgi:hypothetical protein